MAEAEVTYSARQMTQELGVSPQMAGRYYQALEKLTKQKIKTQGRDGRQFDAGTRDVLLAARDLVRTNSGLTVEDSVKKALMYATGPQEVEFWGEGSQVDLERLTAALSEAITAPLVAELRALRESNEALRAEVRELQKTELAALPKTDIPKLRSTEIDDALEQEMKPVEPNTFSKLGMRLDKLLSRFR